MTMPITITHICEKYEIYHKKPNNYDYKIMQVINLHVSTTQQNNMVK